VLDARRKLYKGRNLGNEIVLNVRKLRRPAGSGPSADRRFLADWPAELRAGATKLACTVIDVSSAGACLRIDHVLPRTQDLFLVVADVPPVPVAVAWREKNRLGLRFLEEQKWVLESDPAFHEPAVRADSDLVMQSA
jgi:hypothetical protein